MCSLIVSIAYGSRAAIGPPGQNFLYRSRLVFILPEPPLFPLAQSIRSMAPGGLHISHLVILANRGAVAESMICAKIIIYQRGKRGSPTPPLPILQNARPT